MLIITPLDDYKEIKMYKLNDYALTNDGRLVKIVDYTMWLNVFKVEVINPAQKRYIIIEGDIPKKVESGIYVPISELKCKVNNPTDI